MGADSDAFSIDVDVIAFATLDGRHHLVAVLPSIGVEITKDFQKSSSLQTRIGTKQFKRDEMKDKSLH